VSEIRETLDFVSVVNTALTDVYYSRAKITWGPLKPDVEEQVHRYLSAVTSLVNLVTPILGYRPELGTAEELARRGRYRECVKYLDSIVTELITRLNEAGLLVRGERGVRAGVVGAGATHADQEGSEE